MISIFVPGDVPGGDEIWKTRSEEVMGAPSSTPMRKVIYSPSYGNESGEFGMIAYSRYNPTTQQSYALSASFGPGTGYRNIGDAEATLEAIAKTLTLWNLSKK